MNRQGFMMSSPQELIVFQPFYERWTEEWTVSEAERLR